MMAVPDPQPSCPGGGGALLPQSLIWDLAGAEDTGWINVPGSHGLRGLVLLLLFHEGAMSLRRFRILPLSALLAPWVAKPGV